jgi:hypothetical protein
MRYRPIASLLLFSTLALTVLGCGEDKLKKDVKINVKGDQTTFRWKDEVELWLTFRKKRKLKEQHLKRFEGSTVIWSVDGVVLNKAPQTTKISLKGSDFGVGTHTLSVTGTYLNEDGQTVTLKSHKSIQIKITTEKPVATIAGPAILPISVRDSVTLRGSATDPDPFQGTASIADQYLTWREGSKILKTGSSTLTLENLSGGRHVIVLEAKDEFDVVGSTSVRIDVQNQLPEVRITSGSSFKVNQVVTLRASVSDPDGLQIKDEDVTWSSNRDGDLGRGPTLTLAKDRLQAGTHRITCWVTDAHDGKEKATSVVDVANRLPEVEFQRPSPSDRDDIAVGEAVFEVNAFDPDGLPLEKIVWTSSQDGVFARDVQEVEAPSLSGGRHTITCTVTDHHKATKKKSISIVIVNLPPEVRLTQPTAQDKHYSSSASVRFRATIKDPEGFPIQAKNVSWTLEASGRSLGSHTMRELGSGRVTSQLDTSDIPPGNQRVICTVTDQHGGTESDSVRLLITNEAPVATILSPSNGFEVPFGHTLHLTGMGTDEEDRLLPGFTSTALTWRMRTSGSASVLKEVGTGQDCSVNGLSFGEHTIFLQATDSDERKSEKKSVTIVVPNHAPVVTLSSPAAGWKGGGKSVLLSGAAFDPDRNKKLPGRLLRWQVQRKKLVGDHETTWYEGGQVSVNLVPGSYRIRLIAVDPDDASLKARSKHVTVTIVPSVVAEATTGLAGDAVEGILSHVEEVTGTNSD